LSCWPYGGAKPGGAKRCWLKQRLGFGGQEEVSVLGKSIEREDTRDIKREYLLKNGEVISEARWGEEFSA